MGIFTKIPQNTFDTLQVEAGVLLKTFDPANPAEPASSDIITATTGGITISCKPTYQDYFEDVDNAPNNVKEGKRITGWEATISTTAIGTSLDLIKLALGAATVTSASKKVVPKAQLDQDDFVSAIWWVGDRADGGLVAVKLMNALSTGGFSLKTTKSGKGNIDLEIMGHVSINAQDVVPIEIYSFSDDETEYIGHLTVASAAGTTVGYTALTISDFTLGSGESYVYSVDAAGYVIPYGADLSSWTDWDGDDEISATTGQVITVAAVDGSDKAVAAGYTTVTAKTA